MKGYDMSVAVEALSTVENAYNGQCGENAAMDEHLQSAFDRVAGARIANGPDLEAAMKFYRSHAGDEVAAVVLRKARRYCNPVRKAA